MPDEFDSQTTPADATVQSTTSDPTTQDQSAAPTATPQGTAAPAPTQQASDTTGWVPPYRLREVREQALRQAQEQWATERSQLQAQMEQVQRQLHAVVGVTPQGNQEVDAIRQQFYQLFPGLERLEREADNLLQVTERSGDMEAQQQHYWQSYGRQAMDRLYSTAEKSIGGPLSPEGKRALHSSFLGFVSSSPDMIERYTSDPAVVEEFWKMFSSSLIDPVRRNATATVQQVAQRHLPQDRPAGIAPTQAAPKPADLDERAANAWTSYQASIASKK